MIQHVLRAAAGCDPVSTTVVVSPGNETQIRAALNDDVRIAIQHEPLGTADALKAALLETIGADFILLLFARSSSVDRRHRAGIGFESRREWRRVTTLTCIVDDAAGYGRIERDDAGRPIRVGGTQGRRSRADRLVAPKSTAA